MATQTQNSHLPTHTNFEYTQHHGLLLLILISLGRTEQNRKDKRDQTSSSSNIPRGLVHAYGFVTIPKRHPWAHHSSLHEGPTPLNAIFPSSIHLIKDFNFYCGFRFSYITSKIHRYLTQLCMFYAIAGCLLRILVDLHLLPNFG